MKKDDIGRNLIMYVQENCWPANTVIEQQNIDAEMTEKQKREVYCAIIKVFKWEMEHYKDVYAKVLANEIY